MVCLRRGGRLGGEYAHGSGTGRGSEFRSSMVNVCLNPPYSLKLRLRW